MNSATPTRLGAWIVGVGLVVAADQVTKVAGGRLATLPGVVPVHNPGLSLGLVDGGRRVELVAMLAGLVLAACYLVPRARGAQAVLSAALLLGGATGNLIDRAVLGYVRDFLVLGPVVVNVADLAVVAGLALTLARLHRRRALPVEGGEHACSVPAPGS